MFASKLKGEIRWISESAPQNGLSKHMIRMELIEIISSVATTKANDPKRTKSEPKKDMDHNYLNGFAFSGNHSVRTEFLECRLSGRSF